MTMRCTTVKVEGFAHLMYVILHNGRVVREWELVGVQGGTQRVGCREAMPGSGMNRLLGQRFPQIISILCWIVAGLDRVDQWVGAECCSCHMPHPWRLSIRRLFAGIGER